MVRQSWGVQYKWFVWQRPQDLLQILLVMRLLRCSLWVIRHAPHLARLHTSGILKPLLYFASVIYHAAHLTRLRTRLVTKGILKVAHHVVMALFATTRIHPLFA
jgi:hypothetical protein